MKRIVIIGGGQAAAQATATLRAESFDGTLTLVGDEPFLPYQRPPLSKAYLAGSMERERLFLKPDAFYREAGCELMLGRAATAIDRRRKLVTLSDGQSLPYDKLLLATGTRVRRCAIPGCELSGIFYLRGIADVDAMRPHFAAGARLAVVGGGYIGLEVAAVARKLGLDVTVFEALDRVMARAVSPPVSQFYAEAHEAAGVRLRMNTLVDGFEGHGRIEAVRAGGELFEADLAVVGIGVLPNAELAEQAGLTCQDGIVVDQHCASTNDDSIFAAGDCTQHMGRDGRWIRLECVQNAIDQAKHAALAMLGKPRPYGEVPWFWSDQYDLKLQIAGLPWPGDELVLRGSSASRRFAVFHLRNGTVAAVEAVNGAPEYLIGRKLIAERTPVSVARLANSSVPIKNVVENDPGR